MIQVFKDVQNPKARWHILKALQKEGLASIVITSYCGEGGAQKVTQVPDRFLSRLCNECQNAVEKV